MLSCTWLSAGPSKTSSSLEIIAAKKKKKCKRDSKMLPKKNPELREKCMYRREENGCRKDVSVDGIIK